MNIIDHESLIYPFKMIKVVDLHKQSFRCKRSLAPTFRRAS